MDRVIKYYSYNYNICRGKNLIRGCEISGKLRGEIYLNIRVMLGGITKVSKLIYGRNNIWNSLTFGNRDIILGISFK